MGHNDGVVRDAKRVFNLVIAIRPRNQGAKEQIDDLALNSPGVRDTARLLGINTNTVIAQRPHLKDRMQEP